MRFELYKCTFCSSNTHTLSYKTPLPQRKRESSSVLWQMRRQLLLELVAILPRSRSTHEPNDSVEDAESSSGYSGLREEHVVKASALLRLYCALMGIAGLR